MLVARLVTVEPPAVVVGVVVDVPLVVVPVELVPVAVVVAGPEDPGPLLPVVALTVPGPLVCVEDAEPLEDGAVGDGLPEDGDPDPDPDPDPDDGEPDPDVSEGVAGGVAPSLGTPAGTGSGARLATYVRGAAAAPFEVRMPADASTTPGIAVQ